MLRKYCQGEEYILYQGNMLNMSEVIEKESIDSIVTDPPYGLTSITKRFGKESSTECQYGKDGSFQRLSRGFMGKEWDGSGIEYDVDTWKKCYEILKPGGYLLAFGGSRTFHRIAVAIEEAGFEIRDTIMWLYGSGFPKSMNIEKAINKKDGVEFKSKPAKGVGFMNTNNDGYHNTVKQLEQIGTSSKRAKLWRGYGTALKPSFEPIIVARKPFKGSLVDNVIKNGVGGINIDECRVEYEKTTNPATNPLYRQQNTDKYKQVQGGELSNGAVSWTSGKNGVNEGGRFPANTILTYDENDFEEVCGGFPKDNREQSNARYFYCAKASKKDRDEGLDLFDQEKVNDGRKSSVDNPFQRGETPRKNTHPTVKPTDLMQYLVRLVTPNGGTVLDPFNGSGSTGKAVMFENKERNKNYKYIGIELTEEYLPIAKARIEFVSKYTKEEKKEDIISGQMSIYECEV